MSESVKRPPIIAVMGHVDHGKTSLMDYIKQSNVASREAGGITQGVRAFKHVYNDMSMTFIDTPGHEAFAKMRERGSKIADIILLVVATTDGVKPQTKEVINLALQEKTPLIVALNKIDMPGSDVTKTKSELAQNGIMLEGWGGNVVSVPVSAKTGEGVDNLLEMIHLVSELEQITYDPGVPSGIVLESLLNKNVGPESFIIIKSGDIHVGDYIYGDTVYGKVRALIDDTGKRIDEAHASDPVRIQGLDSVLHTGETILASKKKENIQTIEKVIEEIKAAEQEEEQNPLSALDALMAQSKDDTPHLNVILKADVAGSIEAIEQALLEQANDKVKITIKKSGTGEVTESDVSLAKSSRAVIIAFNINPSSRIQTLVKNEKVILMKYSVIYELIDDVLTAAESLIPPESFEVFVGSAEIIQVFTLSNNNFVAGSIVKDGKIMRGFNCYVTRDKERVYDGKITSIRHLKDEIKEATKGLDCGISVMPNFEFKIGDVINCVRIEKS